MDNQSSKRVRFNNRPTVMFRCRSWSIFETHAFTWLIVQTSAFIWSVFIRKDRYATYEVSIGS